MASSWVDDLFGPAQAPQSPNNWVDDLFGLQTATAIAESPQRALTAPLPLVADDTFGQLGFGDRAIREAPPDIIPRIDPFAETLLTPQQQYDAVMQTAIRANPEASPEQPPEPLSQLDQAILDGTVLGTEAARSAGAGGLPMFMGNTAAMTAMVAPNYEAPAAPFEWMEMPAVLDRNYTNEEFDAMMADPARYREYQRAQKDYWAWQEQERNRPVGERLADWMQHERAQIEAHEKTLGLDATLARKSIPFVSTAMDAAQLDAALMAANKVQAGEFDDNDVRTIGRFLAKQQLSGERSGWQQVGDVMAQMPAFMGELMMTGGVYRGTSAGGKATLKYLAKKVAGEMAEKAAKKTAVKIAGRAVAGTAGAAALAAANPQLVTRNTLQRMLPEVEQFTDENGKVQEVNLVDGSGKSFLEALPAGYADATIEVGSEMAGGALVKGAGSILSRIPVPKRLAVLRRGVIAKWLAKPGNTIAKLNKELANVGWNGIIGEGLEERFGDVLRLGAQLEGFDENVTGQLLSAPYLAVTGDTEEAMKRLGQAGSQLGVEAAAFAIPGAATGGLRLLDRSQPTIRKKQQANPERFQVAVETLANKVQSGAVISRGDLEKVGISSGGTTPTSRRKLAEEFVAPAADTTQPITQSNWQSAERELAAELPKVAPNYAASGVLETTDPIVDVVKRVAAKHGVPLRELWDRVQAPTDTTVMATAPLSMQTTAPMDAETAEFVRPERVAPSIDMRAIEQAPATAINTQEQTAPLEPAPPTLSDRQRLGQIQEQRRAETVAKAVAAEQSGYEGRKAKPTDYNASQGEAWLNDAISRRPEWTGNDPARIADWIRGGFGDQYHWRYLRDNGLSLDQAIESQMAAQAIDNVPKKGFKKKTVQTRTGTRESLDELNAKARTWFNNFYDGARFEFVGPSSVDEEDAAAFVGNRGYRVVFVKSDDPKFRANGAASRETGVVFIRSGQKKNALWRVVGHEVAHVSGFDRGSKADESLIDSYAQKRLAKASDKYRRRMELDPDLMRREGVAEMVGEFMSDPAFREQLKRDNPSLWQRIRDAILKAIGQFTPRDVAMRESLDELRQTLQSRPIQRQSRPGLANESPDVLRDKIRQALNAKYLAPRSTSAASSESARARREKQQGAPSEVHSAATQASDRKYPVDATRAAQDKARIFAELFNKKNGGSDVLLSEDEQASSEPDPQLIAAAADMTVEFVQAGVTSFRDFIRQVANVIGRDTTIRAGNYLRDAWDFVKNEYPDAELDSSIEVTEALGDEHTEKLSRPSQAASAQTVQGAGSSRRAASARGADRTELPPSQAAIPGQRAADNRGDGAGEPGLADADVGERGAGGRDIAPERGGAGSGVPVGATGGTSPGLRPEQQRPTRSNARRRKKDGANRELGDGVSSGNFRIDPAAIGQGGPKRKYADNVAAIRLLKQIHSEGRSHATRDEQATLAKYVGWGSLPGVFNKQAPDASAWDAERKEVRELLNDAEWEAARASTVNAHYTSPEIVQGMWEMAEQLGFDGGRVIETSAGIGNFLGLQPADIAGHSRWTAVELDNISAGMLRLLYPEAKVHQQGYQEFEAPDNFYDLAISNVPFDAETRILSDKRYRKFKPALHDYFFLKSIDKVRPGGLVMFITSTGTLDKTNKRLRTELADKADLIASIRLPEDTFGKNAGTAVVTDLIILRRRTPGQQVGGPAWTEIGAVTDPAGGADIPINEYYVEHPEQVLGTVDRKSRMYAKGQPHVSRTDNFEQFWREAIERLPEGAYQPTAEFNRPDDDSILLETGDVPGQLIYRDGKIYTVEKSQVVEIPAPEPHPTHAATTTKRKNAYARQIKTVKAFDPLRQAVKEVVNAQLIGRPSEERDAAREAMNREYDKFVAAFGPVSAKKVYDAISEDIDYDLVAAIEEWDENTQQATKGPFFTQDTIRPLASTEIAETPEQAIALSLNKVGRLDLEPMAKMLGADAKSVAQQLVEKELAFNDPANGWVVRDEYLSGNVKSKLADARIAAETDLQFRRNIESLERVVPADITYDNIIVRPGSPWLGTDIIPQFAAKLLSGVPEDFDLRYVESTGDYAFSFSAAGDRKFSGSPLLTEVWGTPRADFSDVVQSLLSQVPIKVYDTLSDGTRVFNAPATEAAKAKVDELGEEFQDWVWSDAGRREQLVRRYNDRHNATVPRKYDGSHLTFPGMAPAGTQMGNFTFQGLRPHQANAVWQAIVRGKGIFAHEVGTGKTMSMAAAAMELRRLGLANKPAIIVPDSRVDATAREVLQLYPSARVFSAARGMTAAKRKATVARIASGNYDIVILTHENLRAMPISRELREQFIHEQLVEIEALLEAEGVDPNSEKSVKSAARGNAVVKKLARMLTATRERLTAATDLGKDTGVGFEESGIDFLIVDEAHKFKSLPVRSRLGNVKGIPSSDGSDRAVNLEMIAQYLQNRTAGRGLILATGTPITNSLAELYVMQRYVQRNELAQAGLLAFDAWASTFGEVVTRLEFDHAGGVSMQSRFAKFNNVPELRQFVSQDMDVVRVDDDQQLAANINRPRREDVSIVVEGSEAQREYMNQIAQRALALKGQRPEKGGDNHLKIASDGTKAALDIRLVQDMLEDEDSKVKQLVNRVIKVRRAVPDGTQMIFFEKGRSTDPVFDLGKDIIDKLVAAGMSRERILDFRGVASDKKDGLVQKLRSGEAWVGIGNTDTLGTGVNAQDYIAAIHMLEPAWTPEAIEQRIGRGWRQGNRNSSGKIQVYTYLTAGSLDSWRWQIVAIKAKGIEEFMLGKSNARTLEDDDAEDFTHLGFEKMQALSSGNPLRIELINVDNDIGRLTRASERHARQKNRIRDEIKREESKIKTHEGFLASQNEDQETFEKAKQSDTLFADPRGRESTERKAAAEALRDTLKAVRFRSGEHTLGEYRGFRVVAEMRPVYTVADGSTLRPEFTLRRKYVYDFNGKSLIEGDDPTGAVTSMEYQLAHIGNTIEQTQQTIDNRRRSAEGMKQDLERPWRDKQKLDDKKILAERLREAIADGRTTLDPAMPKVAQTLPPNSATGFTQAAEQLQKEADEGDEITPAGFGFGGAASYKVRRTTVPAPIQVPRPEVEKRIVAAHGVDGASLAERVKNTVAKVWHVTTRVREHLPNSRKFDPARELFRLMDAAGPASSDEANRTIAAIIDPLDETGRKIFERKIIVSNLRTSVESGQPLRFGFQDINEIVKYQEQIDAVVANNPEIQKALDNRTRVVESLVDELVTYGMLGEQARDNASAYFHQQVFAYVQANRNNRLKPRPKKRGFQKRRVSGPEMMTPEYDYNTSYLEAESEWISDALAELRKEKLLEQLAKQYDELPALRREAKKQGVEVEQLVRQRTDLALWQPVPGNAFYRAFTIPERLAEEVLFGISDQITKEQIRTALAVGSPRPQMALPVELVEELNAMMAPRPSGWLKDTARSLMGLWKAWILLSPERAIGYMARNVTGDIDPVLGARPQSLKYTNQAIGELWRYHTGRLALTASLRKARDLGVISSTMTAQEIPKIKDLPVFRRLYSSQVSLAQLPVQAFEKVKAFNEFRESVLRYAAFLDYREELVKGTLNHYGGANPATVKTIQQTLGNDEAAAHLARNLLGDYGNITVAGQFIREYVYPFWSWNEVQFKRWPRLFMNALIAGRIGSKRSITKQALLTGFYISRLATWTAMQYAWNMLMFPDDEEELSIRERASPHLLFGRRPDGSIRILRNTGALGDLVEWFGLTTAISLWPQYEAKQISAGDVLKEMGKGTANKGYQGLAPQIRGPFEALAGVSVFPDMFTPRPIARDEAITGLLGLRDPYRAVKGKVFRDGTRPRRNYGDTMLGIGTVDPRREVMNEIYSLRERFLANKGRPRVNVMRISDFSPMRESAYANDYEAFKEARDRYRRNGRTLEHFVDSVAFLDPISARLSDEDEKEFEQEFLNGTQRQQLQMARDYANELRGTMLTWWWKAAKESDSTYQTDEIESYTEKRRLALRKQLLRAKRGAGEPWELWERRFERSENRRSNAQKLLDELERLAG